MSGTDFQHRSVVGAERGARAHPWRLRDLRIASPTTVFDHHADAVARSGGISRPFSSGWLRTLSAYRRAAPGTACRCCSGRWRQSHPYGGLTIGRPSRPSAKPDGPGTGNCTPASGHPLPGRQLRPDRQRGRGRPDQRGPPVAAPRTVVRLGGFGAATRILRALCFVRTHRLELFLVVLADQRRSCSWPACRRSPSPGREPEPSRFTTVGVADVNRAQTRIVGTKWWNVRRLLPAELLQVLRAPWRAAKREVDRSFSPTNVRE